MISQLYLSASYSSSSEWTLCELKLLCQDGMQPYEVSLTISYEDTVASLCFTDMWEFAAEIAKSLGVECVGEIDAHGMWSKKDVDELKEKVANLNKKHGTRIEVFNDEPEDGDEE